MTYNAVPCNGCTACCKSGNIVLHSAFGDDPDTYETEVRGDHLVLAHKSDGSCYYLNDNGCSIHSRAPATCRAFDCRVWAKSNWVKYADVRMAREMLEAARERTEPTSA